MKIGAAMGAVTQGRAIVCALALSSAASCANEVYEGVDLRDGAVPPEVQALARGARAGDKQAQFALGRRYERGDGVPRDEGRAAALYRAAAEDSGGVRMAFVPGKNGTISTVPVSVGPVLPGLLNAKIRVRDMPKTTVLMNAAASGAVGGRPAGPSKQRASYRLTWFELTAPPGGNVFKCQIGARARADQCRPGVRVKTAFKQEAALYMSRPIATLDGELSCPGVVCSTGGGDRIVVEVEVGECIRVEAAAIVSKKKILSVRVFCSRPGGKTVATDYIDQQNLNLVGASLGEIAKAYMGN